MSGAFDFKFTNMLGGVYSDGNVLFTGNSKSLLSPVSNRVAAFELTNSQVITSPFEAVRNIRLIALSQCNKLLAVIDQSNTMSICSFRSHCVLSKCPLPVPAAGIYFTRDSKRLIVLIDQGFRIYDSPSTEKCFNGLVPICMRNIGVTTTCIDVCDSSRYMLLGSSDSSVRLYPIDSDLALPVLVFGAGQQCVVGCFFTENSEGFIAVTSGGKVRRWTIETLQVDIDKHVQEMLETRVAGEVEDKPSLLDVVVGNYERFHLRSLKDDLRTFSVTACDYRKAGRLLACGLNTGIFMLIEMWDFSIVHTLSISDRPLTSISFNPLGQLVAIASKDRGQLLVWEHGSESFVLKLQAHLHNTANCVAFSPDATLLATGAHDGKLKIWSALSSACLGTFEEHSAGISAVVFKNSSNPVVISSSLDGTVRAFDISRNRNFRTMTSPRPVQFTCVDIDSMGDLVAAGGLNEFDVYVWSLKTGHLLEVLSGHTSAVSGLRFSPGSMSRLASCSWDRTVRTWDLVEAKTPKESVEVFSDALCLAYRPDGKQIAVSTLKSQIVLVETESGFQTGTIDAKYDIGFARSEGDRVTASKQAFGRAFKSLCYTADSQYILAAGKTKYICIYHVAQKILIKRIVITMNQSLEGIKEILNKRKMTEWGNQQLIEMGNDEDEKNATKPSAINLPGCRKTDNSGRSVMKEIDVSCVHLSPTGRTWAACSTEGVRLYSLDATAKFDPCELSIEVTPESIIEDLKNKKFTEALNRALQLSHRDLVSTVIKSIPLTDVKLLVKGMTLSSIRRLLRYLSETLMTEKYIEMYLVWIHAVLTEWKNELLASSDIMRPVFCDLQRSFRYRFEPLRRMNASSVAMMDFCKHVKLSQPKFKLGDSNTSMDTSEPDVQDSDASNVWTLKEHCSIRDNC